MTVPIAAAPTAPRRRGRTAPRTALVAALAAAAAAAAAVATDAAPTGLRPLDVLYRAGLAALVTVAAARAHRWTLVLGGVVTTACAGGWARLPCALALVAAAVLLATHQHERSVRAAAGGAIAVGALSMTWPTTSLVTAALAAVALGPVVWTGVRRFHHRGRRAVAVIGGVLGALAVAGIAGAGWFAASSVDDVRSGVREATAAVDGLGAASPTEVRERFGAATSRFRSVDRAASSWWLLPARALPVVAPHLRLATDAARSGADLGDLAGEVAVQATDERLRRPDGSLDLQRLAALRTPAARAARELARVRTRLDRAASPWLLAPVARQTAQLDGRLGAAVDAARTAENAARRAPGLLGAERPRRYLVLLGNPAEARDLGGHIGNWAEVVASNGKIDVRRVGQPYDLYGPGTKPRPTLTPGAYPTSLVELGPDRFPQNWGGSPDLPTVARLGAEMWSQVRPGEAVDGVAYADPVAFAALLELTGPVVEPSTGTRLTPSNAVAFLTRDQFARIRQTGQGGDPLGEVIEDALRRFTSSQLPRPERLGKVLGPAVRRGHLQFASLHAEDAGLLRALGLDGTVERPGAGDLLAVVNRNANPSKIDAYLRRSTDYRVAWNVGTGETRAVLTVRLANEVPTNVPAVVRDGPPGTPNGTNRTQLCALSPLDVRGAFVDGAKVGVGSVQELRGVQRHCLVVDVPPRGTREVKFNLLGQLGASVPYRLRWVGQPLLDNARGLVTVSADGTTVDGGRPQRSVRVRGDEDTEIVVTPDRYPPQPGA